MENKHIAKPPTHPISYKSSRHPLLPTVPQVPGLLVLQQLMKGNHEMACF